MKSARDAVETLLLSLRELYGRHGYTRYKMNKFEEYDLYAKNKDFLVSERVLTFTDATGKLLALKPDVTLSIVKNTKDIDSGVRKLYYDENVYRVDKGSRNFKEIMQTGLECIGDVDAYCLYEVLDLARRSLDRIGNGVLRISHLGILSEVLCGIGVGKGDMGEILDCIGQKNPHGLSALLKNAGVSADGEKALFALLDSKKADEKLKKLLAGYVPEEMLAEFCTVMDTFANDKSVSLDFSVVGDIHYYNGFVCKGFVEGIPRAVLSGGQYDMLMRKMGRSSHAVGFAVYLDAIGQYAAKNEEYDADIVLLYDETTRPDVIGRALDALSDGGTSVLALRTLPDGLCCRRVCRIVNGEVCEV